MSESLTRALSEFIGALPFLIPLWLLLVGFVVLAHTPHRWETNICVDIGGDQVTEHGLYRWKWLAQRNAKKLLDRADLVFEAEIIKRW